MFCIAAFIVLAIIGIFSASQRKLAKKAWECTLRRVTFRPCDTTFKDDVKNKLLSHVATRTPKLVKAADIGIEVASFILVILTVWSLLSVMYSGLNIFVWGTCTPNEASSCSLTSETCSIDQGNKGFWQLLAEGRPWDWFINGGTQLIDTFANIPNRLKNWEATDYLPQNATYYFEYDESKPTALEILDPGCIVCSKLFKNIKEAGFENSYNLSYIAYPIKNPYKEGEYKFKNSYTVTRYLEAIKINPLAGETTPTDWQIIERIFTTDDENGLSYQTKINSKLSQEEAENLIINWLSEIGYSNDAIEKIKTDADSQAVSDIISDNSKIVKEGVNTLKIPTIIFDGKRHDGSLSTSKLQ